MARSRACHGRTLLSPSQQRRDAAGRSDAIASRCQRRHVTRRLRAEGRTTAIVDGSCTGRVPHPDRRDPTHGPLREWSAPSEGRRRAATPRPHRRRTPARSPFPTQCVRMRRGATARPGGRHVRHDGDRASARASYDAMPCLRRCPEATKLPTTWRDVPWYANARLAGCVIARTAPDRGSPRSRRAFQAPRRFAIRMHSGPCSGRGLRP